MLEEELKNNNNNNNNNNGEGSSDPLPIFRRVVLNNVLTIKVTKGEATYKPICAYLNYAIVVGILHGMDCKKARYSSRTPGRIFLHIHSLSCTLDLVLESLPV